ncbi:MAG: tRNA (adenosine(37)-N6)-threonylcarbamoyltransferase complex dimerization subunit type 1 TsaB [Armatimonadetes bacterium JP3_11]|jgi:tRNA threonylcarbamoyladenosine biosynthesis protein TsaB|nr:MAG: tRNA (adenosine(37)-N6)-threonylcarbamoyltransferase complex dimerization subunit type 1 TsaB [Armatimonadetes bacterium JP3_11]
MAQTVLLAIEATGTVSGIALTRDGALLGSVHLAHGMNLSGNLLHATEWLLERQRLQLVQVDAIAVDIGPGAFTALKIGVTMAKMWAHALNKPLIAVSAFEACAAETAEGVPTLVALPARRDALYLQWLLPMPDAVPNPLCEPAFVVQGEVESWLVQHTPQAEPLQAIGVERARLWIAPHLTKAHWRRIESPLPEGVAHVAWRRWQQKEFVHPFSLTPLYIQPPSIDPSVSFNPHH